MILDKLFLLMSEKQASDIFISAGAPINIKIQGNTMPVNQQVMLPDMIEKIAYELMSPEQTKAFEATWEMNLSFGVPKVGNFRVNIFRQRGRLTMSLTLLAAGGAMFMTAMNVSKAWDKNLERIYEQRLYDIDLKLTQLKDETRVVEAVKTMDGVNAVELWGQWWQQYMDYAQTISLYEINSVIAYNSADFEFTPRKDGWFTFRDLKPRQ